MIKSKTENKSLLPKPNSSSFSNWTLFKSPGPFNRAYICAKPILIGLDTGPLNQI